MTEVEVRLSHLSLRQWHSRTPSQPVPRTPSADRSAAQTPAASLSAAHQTAAWSLIPNHNSAAHLYKQSTCNSRHKTCSTLTSGIRVHNNHYVRKYNSFEKTYFIMQDKPRQIRMEVSIGWVRINVKSY